MNLDAHILGLAASDAAPHFSWLDAGAAAPGYFGARADRVIESDRLDALSAVHKLWKRDPSRLWIGWLTYDAGVDALLSRDQTRAALPGLCMRRFEAAWALRGGELQQEFGDSDALRELRRAVEDAEPLQSRGWPFERLVPELDPAEYRSRVGQAIDHIRAGDTYQVNLSQVFEGAWSSGSDADVARAAAEVHARLRNATPAELGALIRVRRQQWIASNSPETLWELSCEHGPEQGAQISSSPIKGTRPRGSNPEDDQAQAQALLASEKDAAEHVMIVDLIRNDLGRIARPGSVKVQGAPQLVSLPTVHHLVSEVRAELDAGWSLPELVEALFPGGSITGAPKRRTCEIIDKLEAARRSIYCGAILVLHPQGMHVSIPIRTALLSAGGLWLRSGGGIVADSDPESERAETVAKALAFEP